MLDPQYNPEAIELEVQQQWQDAQTFNASEDLSKEKFYCLSMFPYPSGRLHMGHVRNYSLSDVIARYQRMLGKNVMQPMGWDAFGLPAENAAMQMNVPPAKWTYANIDEMRRQFKRLGFAYDWKRELATCKPDYYRWEQWLFLRLFAKGLAYKRNAVVNWDPVDNTVLANEQVIDGRGWRSGAIVERREIPQWFLKITAYAEELLNDLEKLEGWPEQVLTMQRNWIGRSEGVTIRFEVESSNENLEVFTTRADTLLGVTYLAIAPEHPLVHQLLKKAPNAKLSSFIEECGHIKVAEAALATVEKKGMDTGLKARHPITNELLPIWVANFVLMEYGAGAVMSVPAHDQRDFEFAQQYQLPIRQVIRSLDNSTWDFTKAALTEKGIVINSPGIDGLDSAAAINKMADELVKSEKGHKVVHYRLRDWGVSRQRYWGTPIPIINCSDCGQVAVPLEDLPVTLPENLKMQGSGSPLQNNAEFYHTTCPQCHKPATRETDTFDTFIESSWYFARYACFNQDKSMLDDRAKYWLPVDQYVGGIEHAVLHLLYARFIHKTIRDEGLVNCDEPFTRLLTQGMVLKDGAKMSKSKGNVVDPQQLVDKYGADTIRLFMIFTSPPEQALEWSDSGVEGSYRFLRRLWTLACANQQGLSELNQKLKRDALTIDWENMSDAMCDYRRQIHEILQQARYDYERQQFNTVVSGCMKLLNILASLTELDESETKAYLIHEGTSILLRLLAPVVPHITQVLWVALGYGDNVIYATLPKVNLEALKTTTIELIVQVNGKLRAMVAVPAEATQKQVEEIVLGDKRVQQSLSDKTVKKIILVPKKLINIVVG